MAKTVERWLILPVINLESEFKYSKKVRDIYKRLTEDNGAEPLEITLDEIAANQGETAKDVVTRMALHRDTIENLAGFYEYEDDPNKTVLILDEDASLLINMPIEKFLIKLTRFENQVPYTNLDVVTIIPTKGSTERQDDDEFDE